MRRCSLASVLAALSLAASASPVTASVTIGQIDNPDGVISCGQNSDMVQPVTSGNSYAVPSTVPNWTITSWSFQAGSGTGMMLAMKVYRLISAISGMTYMAVAHDGPHPIASSALNTFPASVAVKAGDVLGSSIPDNSPNLACRFDAPWDSYLVRAGNLADNEQGYFDAVPPGSRLDISAVVEPTNTFTLGKLTRNKKKGTATLTANVPNPGELIGSGKGVKVASAAAIGPGEVKLTIRAKGKKKKKLNSNGKVKVKPSITYTPTGGTPSSQTLKVKLKKKKSRGR